MSYKRILQVESGFNFCKQIECSVAWLFLQWYPWIASSIKKLWFYSTSRSNNAWSSGKTNINCFKLAVWLFFLTWCSYNNHACLQISSTKYSTDRLISTMLKYLFSFLFDFGYKSTFLFHVDQKCQRTKFIVASQQAITMVSVANSLS